MSVMAWLKTLFSRRETPEEFVGRIFKEEDRESALSFYSAFGDKRYRNVELGDGFLDKWDRESFFKSASIAFDSKPIVFERYCILASALEEDAESVVMDMWNGCVYYIDGGWDHAQGTEELQHGILLGSSFTEFLQRMGVIGPARGDSR